MLKVLLDVFRMKSWQSVSLEKYLNAQVILILNFRNKHQFYNNMFEVILISEFINPEIRITSTYRPFCQADRQTARISF